MSPNHKTRKQFSSKKMSEKKSKKKQNCRLTEDIFEAMSKNSDEDSSIEDKTQSGYENREDLVFPVDDRSSESQIRKTTRTKPSSSKKPSAKKSKKKLGEQNFCEPAGMYEASSKISLRPYDAEEGSQIEVDIDNNEDGGIPSDGQETEKNVDNILLTEQFEEEYAKYNIHETEKVSIEAAWKKDVKKDLAALFKESADQKKTLREIKSLLRERNVCGNSPSRYSTSDEDEIFALLPPFKLKKVFQVENMETDINTNSEYQNQLIKKLATFGGKTIKDCVINIFNGMFTNKLKTKMCWKGSPPKKAAFKPFLGLRNVFRRAVKTRIRKCTLADIDAEIKLRFNQAQKDYDREMAKERKLLE